ncbi:MAG TPA: SPW repeat protein [Dehalococcoidia bacterium]|nr:SPW repeat protein [Dehalococcoidia bacterium]
MVAVGWFSYVVTVIGLWFIASPWVYGFTGNTALMWNNIVLGAVTAVLSFIAGWVLVFRHAGYMGRAGAER